MLNVTLNPSLSTLNPYLLHKFFYSFKKKCFLLRSKPHISLPSINL